MNRLARVILASASPRRLELLRSLGLEVRVAPSAYAEPANPLKSPRELAQIHAREKLLDVLATQNGEDLVVAADTIVDVDGIAYGKPRDPDDAVRMLRELSGRDHIVHTAFAISVRPHPIFEACESTTVRFFELDEDEIQTYAQSGEPMDKAGGYGIQGIGAGLVERIDGDFYTVMGFPLGRFVRSLRGLGFSLVMPKNT
ncbi:MAG: nucleoside triphosphate pyrophosphatase [Candidatus Baltobacteraceae bacterium]